MAFTIAGGIPQFISGDRVIQFHSSSDMRKNPRSLTLPTSAAYMDDQSQYKHIGELGFFGQRTSTVKPFTIDILENRQVMETGHDGTFMYDVPFYANEQCVTVRDTSDQEFPGLDETTFKLVLSDEFKHGDVLTTDALYGQQVYVTSEPVLQKNDSFEHIVTLVTKNKRESYNKSNLVEGVTYYKLFNSVGGEDETILSGVSVPNKSSKLTCEFRLGNGSGVELSVSAMANIGSKLSTNFKDGFIGELNMDYQEFTKKFGDVAVVFDRDAKSGAILPETARLSDVAEWLVKREHMRMMDNRSMFSRSGRISTSAGYIDIAEGLWHQLRRGKIIPYSRRGGITRRHIKEAVEYVFQGNDILPEHRYIKFKAGKFAYENIQALYSEEFTDQLGRLSNITNLLGTDGQIPKSPITGNLDALGLDKVKVSNRIMIPGLGMIEVEHDPALDNLGSTADRLRKGMHPQGKSHASYALVIWDARKESYSNNKYVPKGTEFMEGAPENASTYLVKKPGDLIFSGRVNGYYDPYKSSDILSSGNKKRFVDYWSWDNGCSYFLLDPSAFVMIELDEEDRRGFN